MTELPNFPIQDTGDVSKEFLKRGIQSFYQATNYIQNLDYGRNSNKDDLTTIFIDNKGTCSTKHAILKQLANENEIKDIKLVLGIFKMNALNTPKVEMTLSKNRLQYIPEAHTYLKCGNNYFDFTKRGASPDDFINDLLFETEIQSNEINQHKIGIHKVFLDNGLHKNSNIKYSLEEIWRIREQCIQDLSE